MGIFGNSKQEEAGQKEGKMMLMTTVYKRLPGHLYYAGTTSDGYLTLCQVPMQHAGPKKQNK